MSSVIKPVIFFLEYVPGTDFDIENWVEVLGEIVTGYTPQWKPGLEMGRSWLAMCLCLEP